MIATGLPLEEEESKDFKSEKRGGEPRNIELERLPLLSVSETSFSFHLINANAQIRVL